MSDPSVLKFKPKTRSAKNKLPDYSKRSSRCEHFNVLVASKERELECADCGVAVDPYLWIGKLASKESAAYWELRKQLKAGAEVDKFVFREGGSLTVSRSGVRASVAGEDGRKHSSSSSRHHPGKDSSTTFDRMQGAVQSVMRKLRPAPLRRVR